MNGRVVRHVPHSLVARYNPISQRHAQKLIKIVELENVSQAMSAALKQKGRLTNHFRDFYRL